MKTAEQILGQMTKTNAAKATRKSIKVISVETGNVETLKLTEALTKTSFTVNYKEDTVHINRDGAVYKTDYKNIQTYLYLQQELGAKLNIRNEKLEPVTIEWVESAKVYYPKSTAPVVEPVKVVSNVVVYKDGVEQAKSLPVTREPKYDRLRDYIANNSLYMTSFGIPMMENSLYESLVDETCPKFEDVVIMPVTKESVCIQVNETDLFYFQIPNETQYNKLKRYLLENNVETISYDLYCSLTPSNCVRA